MPLTAVWPSVSASGEGREKACTSSRSVVGWCPNFSTKPHRTPPPAGCWGERSTWSGLSTSRKTAPNPGLSGGMFPFARAACRLTEGGHPSLGVRLFRSQWMALWPEPGGIFSLADSNVLSHFAVGKSGSSVTEGQFGLWDTSANCHGLPTLEPWKPVTWVAFFNCFPLFEGSCKQQTNTLQKLPQGKKMVLES